MKSDYNISTELLNLLDEQKGNMRTKEFVETVLKVLIYRQNQTPAMDIPDPRTDDELLREIDRIRARRS